MPTRKLAAIGAAALLIGLAASAPAQAGFALNGFALNGFALNGFALNGFMMNGFMMNGADQPVGLNFNDVKLHAVVLPTGTQ